MQLLNGNIEETIIKILAQKIVLPTDGLIDCVRRERGKVTKQGVYRVIRKLKKEQKIVVYKSRVTLNSTWITKLQYLLENVVQNKSLVGNLGTLGEKEKISLKIKSFSHMDTVWANIFSSIESFMPKELPLFLYNPHNSTIVLDKEVDDLYAKKLSQKGRHIYLTIGGNTSLDKLTIKQTRAGHIESTVNSKIKSDHYIAVIGDFIIQVKLRKQDTSSINSIFKSTNDLAIAKKMIESIDEHIIARIVIERSIMKANQWKTKLSRSFYIPKKYRS